MDINDITQVVPTDRGKFDVVLRAPDGQQLTIDTQRLKTDASAVARRVGLIVQSWAQGVALTQREKAAVKRALDLAAQTAKLKADLDATGGLSTLVMELTELKQIEEKLT